MANLTRTIIDAAPAPKARRFFKGDVVIGPKGGLWYVTRSGPTLTRVTALSDATGRSVRSYQTHELRAHSVRQVGTIHAKVMTS